MSNEPKTTKLSDIQKAGGRTITVEPAGELPISKANLKAVLGEPGKGMGFNLLAE